MGHAARANPRAQAYRTPRTVEEIATDVARDIAARFPSRLAFERFLLTTLPDDPDGRREMRRILQPGCWFTVENRHRALVAARRRERLTLLRRALRASFSAKGTPA